MNTILVLLAIISINVSNDQCIQELQDDCTIELTMQDYPFTSAEVQDCAARLDWTVFPSCN